MRRPCGPYFFCKSTSQGISILQGSHQVAQKFSSTALPFKDESRTACPCRSPRVKSGAGAPFLGGSGVGSGVGNGEGVGGAFGCGSAGCCWSAAGGAGLGAS